MFKLVPMGDMPPEDSIPLASVSIASIPQDMGQDEWVESMVEASKDKLLESGSLIPALLFLFIDDRNQKSMGVMSLERFTQNEAGMNMLPKVASKLLRDMNAYAMLFISEAWTKTYDENAPVDINDEYNENNQFHSNGREVIMAVYETIKETAIINVDINRDYNNNISIGGKTVKKLSDMDVNKMHGRMVGWLHNSENLLN